LFVCTIAEFPAPCRLIDAMQASEWVITAGTTPVSLQQFSIE